MFPGRLLCVDHLTDTDLGPLSSAWEWGGPPPGLWWVGVHRTGHGALQVGFRGKKLEGRGQPRACHSQRWKLGCPPHPWQSVYPDSDQAPKVKRGKMKPCLPWVPLLHPFTENPSVCPDSNLALTSSTVGPQILSPLPWEYFLNPLFAFRVMGSVCCLFPAAWA